jgi:hypothetical protein
MIDKFSTDNRDMKKILGLIFISILLTSCNTGTKTFEYGSNNGKQININGKKVYYEEYGQGTPLLLLSGGGLNRSIKDFGKCSPNSQNTIELLHPIHQDKVGRNKPIG